MRRRIKKKQVFLVANLGKAKEIDFKKLSRSLKKIKQTGVNALSIDLHSRSDIPKIAGIYPSLRANDLYLLGGIKNTSWPESKKICLDSFKVSFGSLKKNGLLSLAHRACIPLFVYLDKSDIPRFKALTDSRSIKKRVSVVTLLSNPRRDLFFRLAAMGLKRPIYIGYTDFTEGVVSSILSLSWGAQVVEKKLKIKGVNSFSLNSYIYTLKEFGIFATLLRESRQYLD